MRFREATIDDIIAMHVVRTSVEENTLSNPDLITNKDYEEFITQRGKGWVCEIEGDIVGFAVADLKEDNIWALFIFPEYEGEGIGKTLHQMMLDWYFAQGKEKVWLGTTPNTRAEKFYRKAGWKEMGMHGKNEIKFEMHAREWIKLREI